MAISQASLNSYIERLKKAGKYDANAKKKVQKLATDKKLNTGGDSSPEKNTPTKTEPTKNTNNNSNDNTASNTLRDRDRNKNTNPTPSKNTGGSNNISKQDQSKIDSFKNGYSNASNVYKDPEKIKKAQDYFHEQSEKIRSKYGFSGGTDGSKTNTIASDNTANTTPNDNTAPSNDTTNESKINERQYLDSEGNLQTGFVKDGITFADKDGTQRVGEGSIVNTSGGIYEMKDGQGVKVEGNWEDMINKNGGDSTGKTNGDSQYDFPESMSEDVKTQIQELGDKWMDIDVKQKAGEISEEEATKLKEEYSSKAEALRNESGYTGGQDGNNFNKIEGTPEFVANEWVKLDDGGEVMYDEDGNINGYRNQELDPETEAMVNSINAQLEESKSTQEFYENAIDELTKGSETKIDVLSYEEALKQAGDQINPIYEKGMNDFMEQSDKNAVRRGVFNQVPTEAYKNYKAGEIQSEKSAQISSLANKLRGQSVNEANQTKQLNMQETQNKLNVLMAGLQASGQANSQAMNAMQIINNIRNQSKQNTLNEENTKWQQEFAENQQDFNEETTEWQQNFNKENQDFSQNIQMAQLTGSLNGEDTMAQKQFDFNKDVTSTQLSQTWSKIKNDSTALSQAQERLGLSYDAQEMNEKQFKLTVQDKAYQMTKEGLASDVAEFDPTTYNALAEQDRQTNQPQGLLPGDAGYSTEATNYLDSMMNQKTESISREEFEKLYESNLSEINSQLGGLDEYKD